MSLTPTNRHNPCPICEDNTGKCRQGREDQDYWQCMIYADTRKGQIINGFRCLGQSKNGLWGQFRINNSAKWTKQQQIEWKCENQQRREEQKASEIALRANALPIDARDRAIRTLSKHFSLSAAHRADLQARGLTDEAIERNLYFSVTSNQKVPSGIPKNLAGIKEGRIQAAGNGYACVTFDPMGKATGWQVRIDGATKNKYRWAKGEASSHLSNGELPITSAYPVAELKSSFIGICEGINKAIIAANRLGQIFIGASGSLFTASPEQVAEHLRVASEHHGGTRSVVFYPDAGSVSNTHVLKAYKGSWELIESLGYEVKVCWWAQIEKTHPDIDELANLAEVQFISCEEFESWAEALKKSELESKPSANPLERSKALCQPSMGFNPQRNYKKISCQNGDFLTTKESSTSQTDEKLNGSSKPSATLLSQENSKDTTSNSSTIQEYVASISKDRQIYVDADAVPEWKRKAHANWRKNRQFTNAIKSIDQWCQWNKPDANTIFFGKAGLGRGKTTLLKKWVATWKQAGNGFLCLGYRNTLLLQMCEQLGSYHLHDKEASLMRADSSAGIALCVDSLWRFSPEDFDGKIIILDEVQSVIKHLLHSSTVRNRDKILGLFHEAIKRSKQVICLDGLLADWCVDYLHTICPEKQIIKAENTYQGKKPVVNYLLGTVVEDEEEGKIKVNDRSPWFKHLMENSVIPVVCSDSQALIEALDNILTGRGLKVLRIDSKTVPEAYVKELLVDCNAYIEKHRPDVLLYTPSAESGVDVSIPDYFTEHFAFFFGVLDVDSMLQMLGRIRDNITKYVWCKSFVSADEKQHSKSPFADTIQKSLNQLLLGDISTSITDKESWNEEIIKHLTAIVANSNNIDTRLSTLIQSIQNFEKSNLRECLREALVESGYTVKDCVEDRSDHGTKAKEEVEAVKRRNVGDIFKAEKIPFELLKELGFDSKWEDRCKVMQARLLERLPGIDETDVWTEDFVYLTKYGDRDFISHQEMFWLFNNPEIAKQQSQKHFHWMAKRLNTFIGNYKSRWTKINALHQIGLPEFLDSGDEWVDNTPELIKLCERAKAHSNALGWQGKLSNIQFLGKLLTLIGLKLKSRKIGQNIRCYHINREVVNDPIRVQVLACIERKFAETPAENLSMSDWENAINEAHGILPADTSQNQTEQGVQAETPDPIFVYRNQWSGVSTNLEEKASEIQEDLGCSNLAITQKESTEVEQLIEALPFVDDAETFAAVIEGESAEVVEDAIALSGNQPRRKQLQAWLEAVSTATTKTEAHIPSKHPPLTSYSVGDEVTAYFPHSEAKWLTATVAEIGQGWLRAVSGFLGSVIERDDAICASQQR